MKQKPMVRLLALLLLLAAVIGLLPSALAADLETPNEVSILEADYPMEDTALAEETDTPSEDIAQWDFDDDWDGPRSDDGAPLTRDEVAAYASTTAMGKTDCVTFPQYTSPTWYCNRYYTDGTHKYGHYFYASAIAYHSMDGDPAYCIEPNTTSIAGASYSGYSGNSASSTSYWMYELDATQRSNIQKILAFGYPNRTYGYSWKAEYAATQVLIWEVIMRQRYGDIQNCTDYGLYYAVKKTLGDDLYYAQGVKTNVLFFTRGKTDRDNTKEVWIYDLRNDMPSFGKTNPLKPEHFDDFIACYADGDLSKRQETYSEENPNGRWRKFTIEDILARDKTSLDITWMKSDSGTDDYTLAELLDQIKEKSQNIAKAVSELEQLIGEVEE